MEDTLDIKKVDNTTLKKDELLFKVESLEAAVENYELERKETAKNHQEQLNDLVEEANRSIEQLTKLVDYYNRKFQLVKDIINIEGEDDE